MPQLINQLRYFYEDTTNLFVIAAGSLLEMVLNQTIKFPVGRVTFMNVKPFSFIEFLTALKEERALEELNSLPFSNYAQQRLLDLFHNVSFV